MVTDCVSISAFILLNGIPVEITNSALKTCVITASIKKYKSIIKKKKKKRDRIVFRGRFKLDTNKVLISKALINSYISHHEIVSVNNVLREYNQTIENPEKAVEYSI